MDELDVATFSQSNQARLILKMALSNYSWYNDCFVIFDNVGYYVLVGTSRLNDSIKKLIPQKVGNVIVKIKADTHD